MNTLYLDLETASVNEIRNGVYKYIEGDVRILLFAYAFNDNPVDVWDCTAQQQMPEDLLDVLQRKDLTLCAHNSNFDRVVLEHCLPELFQGRKWRDTMVRALAHGLPGGLDLLSQIYKLPSDQAKDKEGRKLVHLFCKPNKGKWNTPKTHPKEWAKFIKYAALDVEAMRVLDKKIPTWNDSEDERNLWYLDQRINDRGFAVDVELAQAAVKTLGEVKAKRDAETQDKTNGAVNSASQRDAMLKHILSEYGVELPDLQIATLTRRLNDENLPAPVRELIALRLESSGTSTTKYSTLLSAVCADGRLRGALQFCGASRTGRFSGRIFQPQNLPRPKFTSDIVDEGIFAIKNGIADLIHDNVVDIASSAVRGVIIAPPGKKLNIADLSSIEGRGLAWLAGEEWKVEAYRQKDKGRGHDMYVLTYSRTFNKDPDSVNKKERQLGKVLELALGYGGGVGAFITFANNYNINLDEMADMVWAIIPSDTKAAAKAFYLRCVEEKKTHGLIEKTFVACDSVKRLWREANENIVAYWAALEGAMRTVIADSHNNQVYAGRCLIDRKGSWARIRLPSGRYVCYAGAKISDEKIKYLGVNQYTRKWCNLTTYGGKIAENVTQAVSRDILAHGLILAEENGYFPVLSVHDEIIAEAADVPGKNHKELSKLMSTNPPWADGLPLSAEGFDTYRYRKE